MTRSRMFGPDDPDGSDNASPRTTIVGARPPDKSPSTMPVPVGLQRLLLMATENPSLLGDLMERRALAADAVGVTLTASERAMLSAASVTQIQGMVVGLAPPSRRDFLERAAQSGAVLLGVVVAGPCSGNEPLLTRPLNNPMQSEGGAHPGVPPRPATNPMHTRGGINPNVPPPPPVDNPLSVPIGGVTAEVPPAPAQAPPTHAEPTEPSRPPRPLLSRGIRPDRPYREPPPTEFKK